MDNSGELMVIERGVSESRESVIRLVKKLKKCFVQIDRDTIPLTPTMHFPESQV